MAETTWPAIISTTGITNIRYEKHFIVEFITGGGLINTALPPALCQEGELMVNALLKDLSGKAERKLHITRDQRLAMPNAKIEITKINKAPLTTWQSLIKKADVTWIIAPETNHELLRLTQIATAGNGLYTGSDAHAVDITTSKKRTAALLHSAAIDHVLTLSPPAIPTATSGWVVKPDDGVGCEKTHYFYDRMLLERYLETIIHSPKDWVIQPYQKGKVLSLSLLCCTGRAPLILACNEQSIGRFATGFQLHGLYINKYYDKRGEFESLVKRIVALLPGLNGFVGIDLIYHAGRPFVLEINPRFTTAYVALSRSLNTNVAELILKAAAKKMLPNRLPLRAKPIYLHL